MSCFLGQRRLALCWVFAALLLPASALLLPASASAYTTTRTIQIPASPATGATMTFNFTNIPQAAGNVSVRVELYGDYDLSSEYADVTIDGTTPANNRINPSGGQCNTTVVAPNDDNTRTFTVADTLTADNALTVVVTNSSSVNFATCDPPVVGSNFVRVSLSYTTLPDLDITSSTAPVGGGVVTISKPFDIDINITNIGEQSVTPTFLWQYYYCPSATPTGCTLLLTAATGLDLTAGQTRSYTRTLTLPATATPGTGYIRTVLDSNNAIAEAREDNNDDYDAITVVAPTTPDIVVTASTAPVGATSVPAGGPITVTFTIQNQGVAFTTDFGVRLWHCQNNAPTPTPCFSPGGGTLAITDDFAQGQSRSYTHTFTTNSSYPAGTDYVRIQLDYQNSLTEGATGEANNYHFDAFTLTNPTQPDLLVSASTAPVGTTYVASGNQISVDYTIHNQGSNLTATFSVALYHCPDANTTGCTLGATRVITDDFAPGQSRNYTNAFTLPSGITGNVSDYIRIFVDSASAITESSETNNNRYDLISIRPPDLFVRTSTAPTDALGVSPGQPISFSYEINNSTIGGAITDLFYVSHYYCPANNPTGCVALAANVLITDDFVSGQSRTYNRTYTLPATAIAGTGYIRTQLDSQGDLIKESNEANNDDYDPITIELPDITVSASTAPVGASSVNPGGSIRVDYTLRNETGRFNANFVVTLSYCPNNNPTGCTVLVTRAITDDFTRLQARNYTNTFAIPATATSGTGYIRIEVDSTNALAEGPLGEANNNRYDPITVSTQADLQVTQMTVLPATGKPGDTLTVQYSVHNAGDTTATNAVVRFYYSTDAIITTGDTYLNVERTYTLTAKQTLPATGTYSVTLTLPATATGGLRYLGAIIDYNTLIPESDESNNTASAAITVQLPAPDLVATSVSATPTSALPGASVVIAYKVDNTGNADVPAYDLRIYFSADAVIDATDTPLATLNRTNLAAGSAHTGTVSITLPSLPAGAGFIGLFVDYNAQINEASETNNTVSSGFTVLEDIDQDGVPSTLDCDDNDKDRFPAYNGKPANAEICDGKDNDCNGLVDDAINCQEATPEPILEPTPESTIDAGTTDTPVADTIDCYTSGCATGFICQKGSCIPDPCDQTTCNADEVCRAGSCVKICGCLKCNANELCEDGVCKPDLCATVTCNQAEICNPADGKCIPEKCTNVTCGKDRICQITDGMCIDDPCAVLNCPQGNECKNGQCVGTQCSNEPTEPIGDTSPGDGDVELDAGSPDATPDTGTTDTGTTDTGTTDTGTTDTGSTDTGTTDTGSTDTGTTDTGSTDTGTTDTGTTDTGTTENVVTTDTGPVSDTSTGTDNAVKPDENAPPPGGCCEMGKSNQAPFAMLLILLVGLFLPSLRKRQQNP